MGRPLFWEESDGDLPHVFRPLSGLFGLVIDSREAHAEGGWERTQLAHLPLVRPHRLVPGPSEDDGRRPLR